MRVRVLEKSFIDNRLVDEGAIIEYDGDLGPNLVAVDAAPPKRGKAAPDSEG